MRRTSILPLTAVALTSLACLGARDPGPLEDEHGKVLFWEVVDQTSSNEDCTDDSAFQAALALPPLEPNTFFMVRIAENGATANATECTETRAETCTDLEDFEFEVDGNTLVHVQTPEVVDSGAGCEVAVAAVWTMEDGGDLGALDVSITFDFDGDEADCQSLDDAIAADSTNGDGLMACEALLVADLEFHSAD